MSVIRPASRVRLAAVLGRRTRVLRRSRAHARARARRSRLATFAGAAALVLALLLPLLGAWAQGAQAQSSQGQSTQARRTQLVVYTYDSFVSWGPGEAIEAGFEAAHPGVDVVFVAPGSSGETLARLVSELETGGTTADVFVGISDTQLPRALARGIFIPLDRARLSNLADVPEDLQFDSTGHVVPIDVGYVSLVFDSELLKAEDAPKSLDDLTDARFRGKLIAIDPRTSSVGHAFLMWTIAEYGDPGFVAYWERLAPNLLTITGGWSEAYNFFTSGEAPIVVSYTTDTAYSVTYDGSERYQVLAPRGEAYRQIEGAGIVRGSDQVDLAHEFLNYLLSAEVQELIPPTNWMFPVNKNAALPPEWEKYAVVPERAVHLDPQLIAENEARWFRMWATAIAR